jgi:hypothetical protein
MVNEGQRGKEGPGRKGGSRRTKENQGASRRIKRTKKDQEDQGGSRRIKKDQEGSRRIKRIKENQRGRADRRARGREEGSQSKTTYPAVSTKAGVGPVVILDLNKSVEPRASCLSGNPLF